MYNADILYNRPLTQFNWIKLPSWLGRFSQKLLVAATDGYILAATKAGSMLTPLVFILGFIWGWGHFGYSYVYTESLWFLMMAMVIGSISGHLGLFFTIGFMLSDLLLSKAHFIGDGVLMRYFGMTISYILLLMVTTVQPITVKYLVAELKLPRAIPLRVRLVVAGVLYGALTFFFLYFWTKMAPVLIRPVFTWQGSQPTVSAITIMQNKFQWLVWPGVLAAILRFGFQSIMVLKQGNQSFFTAIENYYADFSAKPTLSSRINPWIKTFVYTGITTLVLSGMLLNWKAALAIGSLAFFFQALTAGLIPRPNLLNKWAAMIYRIPSIFRLIVVFMILMFITNKVIQAMWNNSNAFLPLVVPTCSAFLIIFLFNPGNPEKKLQHDAKV